MNQSQTTAIVAVAVVAVAAIGGGLAYSAKNAEPGDMLYGVRASLYSDAEVGETGNDIDAARDAYNEAVSLQARGELTASEQTRINAVYSMRVNAVVARIADLEANGDLEAAAALRTALRAILRDANTIFPSPTTQASSSVESSAMSDDGFETEASESSMQDTQNSSIFIQPSSSVTSA